MTQLAQSSLLSDANLVAYYKMDAGALGVDSKGSYDLTNQASVAETAGKYNGAASQGTPNSTNKLLYRTASYPALGSGAFSIAGWFKFNSHTVSGHFANFCDNASKGVFSRFTWSQASALLTFYRVKSGVAQQGPTYSWTPTDGVWYHIVMTYDGTNIRGYLNNSLVGGPTAASGVGSVDETSGLVIGGDAQSIDAPTSTSCVQHSDVSFWSKALSTTEINILYTSALKLYNGLAKASVKQIEGLAIASVKKVGELYIA